MQVEEPGNCECENVRSWAGILFSIKSLNPKSSWVKSVYFKQVFIELKLITLYGAKLFGMSVSLSSSLQIKSGLKNALICRIYLE